MSADELKRLETAWDGRDLITEDEFFADVLCHPGIPRSTRTRIFAKFCQGTSKLSFQYFVIGVVLLTKVDKDIRFGISVSVVIAFHIYHYNMRK